jgi:hypothetical protein
MNAHRLLVGKPERRGPLGRPRLSGWIIKIDLVEVMWTGLVWLRIGTSGEFL